VRSYVRIALSNFERPVYNLCTACKRKIISFRRCWFFSLYYYFYCYLSWPFLLMFFWSSRMRIACVSLSFCGRLKFTAYGGSVNTGCAVTFIFSNIISYFFFLTFFIFYVLAILLFFNCIY
jgi:hypothetical protein